MRAPLWQASPPNVIAYNCQGRGMPICLGFCVKRSNVDSCASFHGCSAPSASYWSQFQNHGMIYFHGCA